MPHPFGSRPQYTLVFLSDEKGFYLLTSFAAITRLPYGQPGQSRRVWSAVTEPSLPRGNSSDLRVAWSWARIEGNLGLVQSGLQRYRCKNALVTHEYETTRLSDPWLGAYSRFSLVAPSGQAFLESSTEGLQPTTQELIPGRRVGAA